MKFKILFTGLLLGILLFSSNEGVAQSKAFKEIRSIMDEQSRLWSAGDVDGFMEYYWKSEELQFIGSTGLTKGWAATLANYKRSFPDANAMGTLKFDILELNQRSRKVVSMVGRFELTRGEGNGLSGYFLLIWQKIKGKWLIVADHTSAERKKKR